MIIIRNRSVWLKFDPGKTRVFRDSSFSLNSFTNTYQKCQETVHSMPASRKEENRNSWRHWRRSEKQMFIQTKPFAGFSPPKPLVCTCTAFLWQAAAFLLGRIKNPKGQSWSPLITGQEWELGCLRVIVPQEGRIVFCSSQTTVGFGKAHPGMVTGYRAQCCTWQQSAELLLIKWHFIKTNDCALRGRAAVVVVGSWVNIYWLKSIFK